MYKKACMNYMGNKFKLLPQILPLFPKGINKFYDLFGGSGTVSLNVKANEWCVNDLNKHVFNLYKLFKNTSSNDIIRYCKDSVKKWGFTSNETCRKIILEKNKIPFENCRKYTNENPSALGYYFLAFYSFCNQFRFNFEGKFNMPLGNGYFKKENEIQIKDVCEFFHKKEVHVSNESFENVSLEGFNKEKDFVYIDSPYASGTSDAVYNEKLDMNVWNEDSDLKLFAYCDSLNDKGFKFAMSNVFQNKGNKAEHLIEWCERNNFIVHHLDMKYASHGIDNNYTDEVLICNYGEERKDLFDL